MERRIPEGCYDTTDHYAEECGLYFFRSIDIVGDICTQPMFSIKDDLGEQQYRYQPRERVCISCWTKYGLALYMPCIHGHNMTPNPYPYGSSLSLTFFGDSPDRPAPNSPNRQSPLDIEG